MNKLTGKISLALLMAFAMPATSQNARVPMPEADLRIGPLWGG